MLATVAEASVVRSARWGRGSGHGVTYACTVPHEPDTAAVPIPPLPDPHAGTSWWQDEAPAARWGAPSSDLRCAVLVVGGGVTGCSAAWHLARAGVDVVLVDARAVASGASGRNGGFLLAGMAHRPVALAERVGTERALELHAWSSEGVDRLLATARAVDAERYVARTGSLRLAVDAAELEDLEAEAALLEAGGFAVERLGAGSLPLPHAGGFTGGLRFPRDGRSMPAGWVRALAHAAVAAGARIHDGDAITSIDDGASTGVLATTASGRVIRAERVILATEAWLPRLLPELRGVVLPYRSQVLAAAAPRTPDGAVRRVLDHVTWSRRGWDYAQQAADGTLVVGGERDEEVERLRHWEEVTVDRDQAWIESWIRRVLEVEPEVVARWAGVLSQTVDGFPFVGALPGRDARVLCCGGWGGAGNVLGFTCGALIADLARDLPGAHAAIPREFDPARLTAEPPVAAGSASC